MLQTPAPSHPVRERCHRAVGSSAAGASPRQRGLCNPHSQPAKLDKAR